MALTLRFSMSRMKSPADSRTPRSGDGRAEGLQLGEVLAEDVTQGAHPGTLPQLSENRLNHSSMREIFFCKGS